MPFVLVDEPKSSFGGFVLLDEIEPPKKLVSQSKTWAQVAGDTGVDAAKSVIGLGEAAVGLADLATGNLAGKGLAAVGYDPARTNQMLGDLYSDQRQQANRNVADAKGFVDTTKALLQNPSVIAGGVVESAPMMLSGVGAVRAVAMKMLAGAGLTAGTAEAAAFLANPAVASKLALASGAAEGALTAGNIQEQGRQAGRDYTDTAPSAVAGGALTGAIGVLSSKIPGFKDAEVGVATAGMGAAQRQGLLAAGKEIAKGTFKEGVLEEMPQSAQEQVFTNLALGKPWNEGVPEAAAQGMVVGAAQGGGMNVYSAGRNALAASPANPAAPPAVPVAPQETPQNTATPPVTPAQAATETIAKIPETPDASAAETALLAPVALTSLDRVNEIDAELGAVRQRLAALAADGSGSSAVGQALLDATAQSADLEKERSELTQGWPKAVPGAASSFTTEAGARVNATYALMDADDLITSHNIDLRKNPLYPPELQPRERDRAASEMQVSAIKQKLDPARLGLSADAATGAPIVGVDGLVESGNARTIALKRAYQLSDGRWPHADIPEPDGGDGTPERRYRKFLEDNAAKFGITSESVNSMAKPVLVRVRTTPVNRAEFARQANASTVAMMSPSEQAKSDANRIDSMEDMKPDENGDFSNAASIPFVQRFMARLPMTEQAGLRDADGKLSTAGYARVRNAVLAKAYGDSPVLARMTESMDDNLRNVSRALMLAAPKVAQMRSAVDAGARFDADITPDLMAAVEDLSKIKDEGGSVQDALAQTDIMGDQRTPEARQLLQFLNDNMRRPRRMADFIVAYMDALDAMGDPKQDSMFGDTQAPAKKDLLTAAERATQNEIQDSGSKGSGASQKDGPQAGRQPKDAQSNRQGAEANGVSNGSRQNADTAGQPNAEVAKLADTAAQDLKDALDDLALIAGSSVSWKHNNGKTVTGEVVRAPDSKGSVTVRATGAEAGAGVKAGGVFNVPVSKLNKIGESQKADESVAKREFKNGELLSASDMIPYYEQEIKGVEKGVVVPNPRFEIESISEATANEIAIYIDGYNGEQRRLRVSGRTLKHIEESRPSIAKEIIEQLPGMFANPDEVLPDHKHPHKRALLVKNGEQKAGESKPKSHVATVEVEIEIEVNDGFIDIVTIMTAPDRSLKAARDLKNNWSEGQQRTEQAVNSPHPLTAEAANPAADSPDTRPVAQSVPTAAQEVKNLWEGRAQPSQPAASEQAPFAVSPQTADKATTIPSGQSDASVAKSAPEGKPPAAKPDSTDDRVVNEPTASYNKPYESDLFGNPIPVATGSRGNRGGKSAKSGGVQSTTAIQGDTAAPAGEYHVRTIVGAETTRKLGVSRITNSVELAQATAYLYRSAVERFDGIVTDKDSKPLGVIGGFKGAVAQASVYPGTLVGEAVRIPGAAKVWFSHNHPSGSSALSNADLNLAKVLGEVFRGSGVEPMGLMAVSGNQFSFTADGLGLQNHQESFESPTKETPVPVVEREQIPPSSPLQVIGGPDEAKRVAAAFYKQSKTPGIILLNSQNHVSAWVPLAPNMLGKLRHTGGLNAIYRAVSESNAGAAIIVHGGELDVDVGGVKAYQNIAAALAKVDARPLDAIYVGETVIASAAEQGLDVAKGPVLSRGTGGGMDVKVLEALATRIKKRMPNMPNVHVLASPLDAATPKALRDYIEKQGAMGDVDGALHKGELYLFASGLPDALRAEHVLAEHEAAHFGLRAILGDSLKIAMGSIYNNNAAVRQAATELQKRGKLSNAEATEEVIVDIPTSQLVKLNGWRKVVQQARDWLAGHGFDAMAAKLSGWLDGSLTDQQRADLMVASLVRGARAYMAGKRGARASIRPDTMLSGTLAEDAAKQEQWLSTEARARGYSDIDQLAEKNYPLFEKLAELWRKKNPAENGVLLSRAPMQIGKVAAMRTSGIDKSSATVVADFRNDEPIKAHPDYKSAKAGDIEAAARLVQDLVKPSSLEQAREKFGSDVVYVPVHAEEARGRNAIPVALAAHYAQTAGATLALDVVQSNRAFHTGANAIERLIARTTFSGSVQAGKHYVLADDVTTMGSTLADLASYIRSQGGVVSGSVLLTNATRSGIMESSPKTIKELEARHGSEISKLFSIEPSALTWSEAQYLLGFRTTDELRNKVAAARLARQSRLLAKGVSESATGQLGSDITAPSIAPADDAIPDTRLSRSGLERDPAPIAPKDASPLQKAKAKVLSLTSPEALDKLMYDFTDKYIDLKRIRDHIKAIGGTITDLNDAYLGEELYHKRLAKRIEDFLSDEVKPLLADLRARGVGAEAFEQFLHARHAPEANKAMAARNPTQDEIDAGKASAEAVVKALEEQLQGAVARGAATVAIEKSLALAREEGYKWVGAQAFKGTEEERLSLSGMSDAQAQAVMDSLPPAKLKNMEALAARVDAINAKTMDTLGQYGLMDQESLAQWRNAYQFYIPLHRDEAHPDSTSHPIGQGFSVKGDASKRRTGSNAKVTNILGHIAMQREAALTRGEKNTVVKKLYVMAAQNPDPELWEVDRVPTITQVDKKTGFAHTYPDPAYKNKPNVVMLRIAGRDAAIVFNERNPQGVRLAGAMKNMDVGDLGAVLTQTAWITRWFAAVNTQYNPVFGLMNFARDIQAAMLNLSTTPLAGQQAKVAKGVPAALRAVYRVERGKAPSSAEGAKWAKLWDELQEVGGTTGYKDMYSDASDRMDALLKDLKKLDRGQVSQAGHAVVDWLSDYNDAIENGVRLSAYSAALDQGMSRERAASLAKNLTVNFNRKGAKARDIGALYAFFNAAIQGNARMFETLRGPIGKKIMFGGVALGMITSMLGMAVMGGGDGEDDEWEGIPEFVKERAIVIPLGHKDYMAIPLPLGFHVFPNLGRLMAEWAMGGPDKSLGKQAGKVLGSLTEAFNPVGGGSDIGQVIMPTVLDPFLALWRNKDWTGRPIYREDTNSLDPTPGFTRAKDSASIPSKLFAELVNKISGGNEYRPGVLSPTPDQLDYVIGQVTGGIGREVLKATEVLAAPFTGDELPAYKIPIIGRIYGNTRGAGAQSNAFYENVRTLNEVENELKGRNKNDDDPDGFEAREPLTNLIGDGNSQEKAVSHLRKQRKQEMRDQEPGYKDRVKEINTQIEEEMRVLNRAVSRVKRGVPAE